MVIRKLMSKFDPTNTARYKVKCRNYKRCEGWILRWKEEEKGKVYCDECRNRHLNGGE